MSPNKTNPNKYETPDSKKRKREGDGCNENAQTPTKISKLNEVNKNSAIKSNVKSRVLFHEREINKQSPRPVNKIIQTNQYKSTSGAHKWPPDNKNVWFTIRDRFANI